MKLVKLNSLTLANFKGCKSLELLPGGHNLAIFGANGAGKSTCADAYFWLIYGKDSRGAAAFKIKTLTAAGDAIHHLNHTVQGQFSVEGATTDLSRTYREVWTAPRSAKNKEFSGHTTDFHVNSVPVSEREYQSQVAGILDELTWRKLSDPTYVVRDLPWKNRRIELLQITGDITDADVIASNPKLSGLLAILGGRSVDDQRKILESNRKLSNNERESLPTRIDEASRVLDNLPAVDEAQVRAELAKLNAEREAADSKIANIRSGGAVAEINQQRSDLKAKITDLRSAAADTNSKAVRELMTAADNAASALGKLESEHRTLSAERDRIQAALDAGEAWLSQHRARFLAIRDEPEPAFTGNTECPTCGQELPAGQVAEARAKATDNWNALKANRLEANRAEGSAKVQAMAGDKARLAELADQIKGLEFSIVDATELSQTRAVALATAQQTVSAEPKESPEILAALDELAALDARYLAAKESVAGEVELAQEARTAIATKISGLESSLQSLVTRQSTEKRIAELTNSLEEVSKLIEQMDKGLWLIDEFIRTKVALLTERINSRFKIARWKLFEEQVNGVLAECCECVVDGVPYSDLNTGMRLNVGLDVINTLAEHYDIAVPIVIDNAESVTDILPTYGQQLQLIVSAGDKALRIVTSPAQTQIAS